MPFSLDALEHPIVQAPMGGGPSTPALAAAVSEAGGLGFLAAGYKTPDAVRADVAALRALTDRAFGINLFAPPQPVPDPAAIAAYAERLREWLGDELGEPRHDDDHWDAKLALVAELRVPVVSFAFGRPSDGEIAALRDAGCAVWITVTSPEEARAAAGADALIVQGTEAGGHRATFDDTAPVDLSVLAALQLVAAAVPGVPLVATGGLMTGRAIAAVLAAGAAAAQLGTAFMLAAEAATASAHRDAVRGAAPTALTRAFTGRTARGVVNAFLREHDADAPVGYPDVHYLTARARVAARERGDADGFHLWAGQAHSLALELPAGELVRRLAAEARVALREAAERV
jgi:nitronate monooxygenase